MLWSFGQSVLWPEEATCHISLRAQLLLVSIDLISGRSLPVSTP